MNQITLDLQSNPSYQTIALTQGQFAKVDANDYEWLMQWKWYAKWSDDAQSFYACRCQHHPKKTIRMHRLIAGDPVGLFIDHRDGDTLNNQRLNLRHATRSQNQWNRPVQRTNRCGLKGVKAENKKWIARIQIGKRTILLGRFLTPQEAHAAYQKAAIARYGEFASF